MATDEPKRRQRVNWNKAVRPNGKTSNEVMVEYFQVPGNFKRALSSISIARKLGLPIENNDRVVHEVLERLHAEGFTFRKYAKVFLKVIEWMTGYIKARASATRENNLDRRDIQRIFPFYYHICDIVGDIDASTISIVLGHDQQEQDHARHDSMSRVDNDPPAYPTAQRDGGMATSSISINSSNHMDEPGDSSSISDDMQINQLGRTLPMNTPFNGQHDIAVSYVRSSRLPPPSYESSPWQQQQQHPPPRPQSPQARIFPTHTPYVQPASPQPASPEPPSPEPPSPTPSSSSHDTTFTFQTAHAILLLPQQQQPQQQQPLSTSSSTAAITPSIVPPTPPSSNTADITRKRPANDSETNTSSMHTTHNTRRRIIEPAADDQETLEDTPLEMMQRNNEHLRQSNMYEYHHQRLLDHQHILLSHQARIYRIQEMQAQSTLIKSMTDAGFSKNEIAAALKGHRQGVSNTRFQ
ncbi:hypothetical protein O0I10_007579 [Lichtheimia ornata]|uniref:Uncharacterized protein n=1 Tax=Lichtheimia ornata TaxID=688661 RepID=A0AAD7V251_9FUNG|nr:uncharacterized protein O0I10_007579 [Lichtheimia ornata]KAJ8656732.1 hypothetical protein O0I10_007579 [Lichtheimia ornata]